MVIRLCHRSETLSHHPRLHRPLHRRGQNQPRDPPLPQALHRPPALPHPHHCDDPRHQHQRMNQPRQYRYTPTRAPGPCPDHPCCLVLRCARWLCPRTFHTPLNQRANPAATAAQPAESPSTADSAPKQPGVRTDPHHTTGGNTPNDLDTNGSVTRAQARNDTEGLAGLEPRAAQVAGDLAYWKTHLANLIASGIYRQWGPADFQIGDSVEASGRWHQVLRVNPTSLTVPSVAGGNGTHTAPYDTVTDRRPATPTAGQRAPDVTEHQQPGQEPSEN